MIRADEEAEARRLISTKETVDFVRDLEIEEQAYLHALDAECEDAAVYTPPGKMFEVTVSREIPFVVIGTLQRAWEAGGWCVGAFEIVDSKTRRPVREREGSPDEPVVRLVFARPHRQIAQLIVAKDVSDSLERRETAQEFMVPDDEVIEKAALGMPRTSTPLLIRMPTRGRPAQALSVLKQYREMATSHVAIEVIIDEDDATCNETRFLQRLADLDCKVTIGRHKSKIEACNAGRIDDWGVLMLASDDMVPLVRGYDQVILRDMEKHFPLLDGAINYNDGYNRDHVRDGEPITNTLPIMGRWLYEAHGRRVYWPEYKSIYCDTDATFFFTKMNRMEFIDDIIVEHRHFANDKARFDELYQHNSKHDEHDRALFEERRAREFDVIPPILSILICSIPTRRQQCERLVEYLRWQVINHPAKWAGTEIRVDFDQNITVGEKRQRLLERAVGNYVAFIDDDDWVDSKYVARILDAVAASDVDCASLVGIITENGENACRFEHSAKFDGWYEREDGVLIRTPNHLNAIKRDLALQVGFVAKNVGEDHDFSNRIKPLLKKESSTGDQPLYLYWSVPARSVQMRGAR